MNAAQSDGPTFRLADRQRRLAGVRLQQEIGLPGPLDLHRVAGEWSLQLPRPPVDRMEYLFEVTDHNGRRAAITDPANPRRVPGAFGDKSVLEFADYEPPDWLDQPVADAEVAEREIEVLGTPTAVAVWSPVTLGDDEPAPLVVVHDGPEYDRLGAFTRCVATAVAAGTMPAVRVALLDPADRNEWYSANAGYAADIAAALEELVPASARIGVGVSLGALAMLHLHCSQPGTFDALLLQSGSFFTAVLDPQESAFDGFADVTRFVEALHAARIEPPPVPIVLTCGTVEENLVNNQQMTATLQRLRCSARLVVRRDAHNYVAWRDALDPALCELVAAGVDCRAA